MVVGRISIYKSWNRSNRSVNIFFAHNLDHIRACILGRTFGWFRFCECILSHVQGNSEESTNVCNGNCLRCWYNWCIIGRNNRNPSAQCYMQATDSKLKTSCNRYVDPFWHKDYDDCLRCKDWTYHTHDNHSSWSESINKQQKFQRQLFFCKLIDTEEKKNVPIIVFKFLFKELQTKSNFKVKLLAKQCSHIHWCHKS